MALRHCASTSVRNVFLLTDNLGVLHALRSGISTLVSRSAVITNMVMWPAPCLWLAHVPTVDMPADLLSRDVPSLGVVEERPEVHLSDTVAKYAHAAIEAEWTASAAADVDSQEIVTRFVAVVAADLNADG